MRLELLSLDDNNRGRWQLPLNDDADEAILIVAGSTRYTSRPAAYSYEVRQSP